MDDLFEKPIDYLDNRYPFWLTKVLNIGEPIISTTGPDGTPIPTAAIGFRKDGDGTDFDFYMNPEFAASLSDEERAFLMSHEAMHVVRNDMKHTLDPAFEDKKALNQAMDYIVNDTLTNAGMQAPEWALQGMRDLGMDCEGMDVRDIYELVKQQNAEQEQQPDDGEGEEGEGGGEQAMAGGGHGEWTEEMADAAAEQGEGEDGEGEGQSSEGEGEEGREHGREEKVSQAGSAGAPDPDNKKNIDCISEADIPNLDYEELFRRIEPSLVDGFGMGNPPRNDWRRPSRRMMSVYPQAFIPSKRDDRRKLALANKRMQVVVGIDNSASVSAEDVSLFRAIAERLPKAKADYLFVATSGYAVEVPADDVFNQSKRLPVYGASSPRNMAQIATGRGASKNVDTVNAAKLYTEKYAQWRDNYGIAEFDSLECWIQAAVKSGKLREYPKSVLIISDAESFLSCHEQAEHAARWTVLSNVSIRDGAYLSGRKPGDTSTHRGPTKLDYNNMPRYRNGIAEMCGIPPQNFIGMGDLVLKDGYVRTKARV